MQIQARLTASAPILVLLELQAIQHPVSNIKGLWAIVKGPPHWFLLPILEDERGHFIEVPSAEFLTVSGLMTCAVGEVSLANTAE